jgi:hypothetical protein
MPIPSSVETAAEALSNERDFWESISIGAERVLEQENPRARKCSKVDRSSFFAGMHLKIYPFFISSACCR